LFANGTQRLVDRVTNLEPPREITRWRIPGISFVLPRTSDLFGPGAVITEQFTVSGQRHLPPNLSMDGTVFYRVR
jgi:hypothetical protein